MTENNIDKIEIETLEEKECLDRIPSVSDVLDDSTTKEDLSENDKDVRIKELEKVVLKLTSIIEDDLYDLVDMSHQEYLTRELNKIEKQLEQSK